MAQTETSQSRVKDTIGAGAPSAVVHTVRSGADNAFVLVCEHASDHIPSEFNDLGLSAAARHSHIAWDPGALAVAEAMSAALGATLVAGGVSRLVYDCNRPPDASDAMPARSEAFDVPGNAALSAADRAARVQAYYKPFERALDLAMTRKNAPVLVTLHSFTPVYNGTKRNVEIGVLHDSDSRLADAMLRHAPRDRYRVARNAPYAPSDGVTHTLRRHALPHGHLNVMIELRNDLIQTPDEQSRMGKLLTGWLTRAVDTLEAETCKA